MERTDEVVVVAVAEVGLAESEEEAIVTVGRGDLKVEEALLVANGTMIGSLATIARKTCSVQGNEFGFFFPISG